LRYLYQQTGLELPDFLRSPTVPMQRAHTGMTGSVHLRGVWLYRFVGPELAARVSPGTSAVDWTPLEGLALDFYSRYNTIIAGHIPDALRDIVMKGFQECGLAPYTARDHDELELVRRFILAVNNPEDLTF
jgi:hypothetical protein